MQFLDIVDSAIVNVALPSIQHSLHFSQQNLQWVASGYILTYGGFLLLVVAWPICLGVDACCSSVWSSSPCRRLTAGLAPEFGTCSSLRDWFKESVPH